MTGVVGPLATWLSTRRTTQLKGCEVSALCRRAAPTEALRLWAADMSRDGERCEANDRESCAAECAAAAAAAAAAAERAVRPCAGASAPSAPNASTNAVTAWADAVRWRARGPVGGAKWGTAAPSGPTWMWVTASCGPVGCATRADAAAAGVGGARSGMVWPGRRGRVAAVGDDADDGGAPRPIALGVGVAVVVVAAVAWVRVAALSAAATNGSALGDADGEDGADGTASDWACGPWVAGGPLTCTAGEGVGEVWRAGAVGGADEPSPSTMSTDTSAPSLRTLTSLSPGSDAWAGVAPAPPSSP